MSSIFSAKLNRLLLNSILKVDYRVKRNEFTYFSYSLVPIKKEEQRLLRRNKI